ncbi:MAG: hypothetical protein N0E48_03055, partial [Candidatus Thiodiazotropha endolucinida]|nr:hypothetical protein [Candidatus Thiodiazotropha taylori]MCW4342341.1 hypothetical protein [Candidatus Thiodiazotropha endolucinida]
MSSADSQQKSELAPRKKKKSKRKASSPLNDCSGHCSQKGAKAGGVSVNKDKDISHSSTENTTKNCNSVPYCFPPNQFPIMNFTQTPFNMQQPQQMMGTAQPQTPVISGFMNQPVSPPQMHLSQHMFTLPSGPSGSGPPDWASELINDVKQIKLSLAKLDTIEKSVNQITLKVSDLEIKV